MQNVIPALRITEYARSKDFYLAIGFQIDWEHRFGADFPVFMKITREGLSLFLTEHAHDCQVGGLVHLYVADVDSWYAEFRTKGLETLEPPSEDLPGLRMMTVSDPDGNQLRIATRL